MFIKVCTILMQIFFSCICSWLLFYLIVLCVLMMKCKFVYELKGYFMQSVMNNKVIFPLKLNEFNVLPVSNVLAVISV